MRLSPRPARRHRLLAAVIGFATLLTPVLVTAAAPASAATASITGRVTGSGQGLAGLEVMPWVFDSEFDEWVPEPGNAVETGANGSYTLTGLTTTTYRVEVSGGPDHVGEFYRDAATVDTAQNLNLRTTPATRGIDLDLAAKPHIAGQVTDGEGDPVAGIAVAALSLDPDWDEWLIAEGTDPVETDANGRYDVTRLLPGTYRLEFRDESGAYDDQFFDGAPTVEEGTDVRVTAGASRTDVDVTMVRVGEPGVVRNRSLPTITGHPGIGGTLRAAPGGWAPGTGLTFTYQWLVGGAEVPGATDVTYVPREADRDQVVTVEVSAARSGYTGGTATSLPTNPVGSLPPVVNATLPRITGTAMVGSELSTTAGTWTPAAEAVTYQWLRAGSPVPGATAATYRPVVADAGKQLTVAVTASAAGYSQGTAVSLPTAAVDLPPVVSTAAPRVTGTPVVGRPLGVAPGSWSPSDGLTVTYQWLVDGFPVGATGDTYTPTADDLGYEVSVTATAVRDGYRSSSRTSDPTAAVTLPPLTSTARPSITLAQGATAPRVGEPLTADAGTFEPADGVTVEYQWKVGGRDVAGATGDTYTPVDADAGKTVVVAVTGHRDDHLSTTATSLPTGVVLGLPTTNSVAPSVSGTAQVGQRLTARPGTWSRVPVLSYQWTVNGLPVAGQTAPTFTVPASALGRTVAVVVTASVAGQDPVSMTSAATPKVRAGVLRLAVAPKIVGRAKVRQTLRAAAGAVAPAATRVTYQWLRNGKVIKRATRPTYKVAAADNRRRISVRVTHVRAGYTTLVATSRALVVR